MSTDGSPTPPSPTGGLLERFVAKGEQRFLLQRGDFYFSHFEDDFLGDALNARYPAAKTNGTSAAVTFTEHNSGGFLEFVTGTDNAGYAGQGLGMQFTGDRGFACQFLIETPASLADYKLEVGVSDADDDAGGVATKATPTVTMTDGAVLVFDTADDSNLTLVHAKAGVAAAVDISGFTLAVSTKYYITLAAEGDNVKATITGLSGTPSARFEVANAVAAAGLEGASTLTPWVFTQARAGSASKTTILHKWSVDWPAW